MQDNGVFCSLAWTSLGMNPHGRVRACGRSKPNPNNPSLKDMSLEEAWNSDYYKNLRLDMLNGVKNENCEKCYLQEKLNGKSKRLDYTSLGDLEKYKPYTTDDGTCSQPPKALDIRVGNICNLKCVHCWTGNSSKWYEDKMMLDKYENTTNYKFNNEWIEDNRIWNYVKKNIDDIEKINVLGGEPFASKSHNKFIDWCVENNKTNLQLYYVSNGTLLNEIMIEKLKKFKNIRLGISFDAVKELATFLRFPTKWQTLEKNLKNINDKLPNCYFNWTCYNLNIHALKDTMSYCRTHFPNIEFNLGDFVINPVHMSVQNLPIKYKEKLLDNLKDIPQAKFYLDYMMEKHTWNDQSDILLSYLNDLDKVRKTNWRNTLPEIAELYE